MDGCETSQFKNHILAALGRKVEDCGVKTPHFAMVNLVSPEQREDLFQPPKIDDSDAELYWYLKKPLKQRKMGHINLIKDSADALESAVVTTT